MKTLQILPVILLFTFCTKLIAQPNLVWMKKYGGTNNDSAFSIKPLSDGNYIVAGQSSSKNGDVTGNHGGVDYWVAKLAAGGNIIWEKSFGGSGTDIAKCIQPTSDGGFIIAGYSDSFDGDVTDHKRSSYEGPISPLTYFDNPYESWIVKIDMNGQIIWSRSLYVHITSEDSREEKYYRNYASTIIQTSDGGYLLGGTEALKPPSIFFGDTFQVPVVIKLTKLGDTKWKKDLVYVAGKKCEVPSVTEIDRGYVALLNGNYPNSYGSTDVFICTLNQDGQIVRTHKYGGSGADRGSQIEKTTDGGFIIAGYSASTDHDLTSAGNHGGTDYWIFKITAGGTVTWSKCFGGSFRDLGISVTQSLSGNFYIAGSSLSSDGEVTDHIPSQSGSATDDFWIIKINNLGRLLWTKSYGSLANDAPYDIEKSPDGSFVVAGCTKLPQSLVNRNNRSDWLIVKFTDSNPLQ